MRLRSTRFTSETLPSPSISMKPCRFDRYSNSRLIMRLVADERLEEIVRKRHVAARLPVADRLRLLEFAVERDFRPHVEPERQVRPQRDFVNPVQVVPPDPAHRRARDQREDIAVGQHDQPRTQRRQNPPLELVEEIGAVHQRERHARHGIFRQQRVDVLAHQKRPPQPHRLAPRSLRTRAIRCSSEICVERPEPSVPSTTIRLPLSSSGFTPGSGIP